MSNLLDTYQQHKTLTAPALYPRLPELLATAMIAATVTLLTSTGIAGTYAIILLYLLWLPRFFYKKKFVPALTGDVYLIYAFLGLCLASVLWSDYRAVTLRGSLEQISMVLITVVASRLTSTSAFIKGIVIGATIVLLATYRTGHFSSDGVFGSKNQAGFVAEAAVFAGGVYLLSKRRILYKAALMPGFLFCLLCLADSRSATSLVSLAVALLISSVASLVGSVPRRTRWLNFSIIVILGGLIGFVAIDLGIQAFLFQSLGKDTTLTGRTYLWAEGLKIGLENPVLGVGYGAFWVQGRQAAENFWYQFVIPTRTGFHFHDLYIEIFVELGIVGLLVVILLMLASCLKSLHHVLRQERDIEGIFCVGLAFMMLIRSFVEVDFLGQFGFGPWLFFSILPRLGRRNREAASGSFSRLTVS